MRILKFIQRKFEWVLALVTFEKFRRKQPLTAAGLCEYGHSVFSGNGLCSYGHHAA